MGETAETFVPKLSYTVREAAELLGVGRSTLYDAINRNEVPHYRIGSRTRIPGHYVNSILAPATTPGKPA